MQVEVIKTQLKALISERLSIDSAGIASPDTASLFADDGWGIDSVDVLDLVLGIESSFGVRIEQDEDVKRHFESVASLAEYIHRQMGSVTAPA